MTSLGVIDPFTLQDGEGLLPELCINTDSCIALTTCQELFYVLLTSIHRLITWSMDLSPTPGPSVSFLFLLFPRVSFKAFVSVDWNVVLNVLV